MDHLSKTVLMSLLDNVAAKKILVVGDLMLDQYIWGTVERISPEGPIPVLSVSKEEFRLGGAANVAVNLKYLNCEVFPVGLIGKDHSGDRVSGIFDELGIATKGIFREKGFQTIVKQRAITDQQQLLRIDYESKSIYENELQSHLWRAIKVLLPDMDGIILSDYAKGVLGSELIKKTVTAAREKAIPVVCDPGKGVNFSRYQGVTAIKPNRFETEQATGISLTDRETILQAAEKLKGTCKADFITISLDKDGILYFGDAEDYLFIESKVPEVYDVTGAGDTLISTITVLLANNISAVQSTYIANIAAGLETSHLGVVPVPWSEIYNNIAKEGLRGKISTLQQLISKLAHNRSSPLVFTNGFFDNISAGHLRFLMEIGKFPGNLVVAINSDASIARQKGKLPLLKEQDRARLLASVENVHHVLVFDEDDATSIIRALTPDIVVKGEHFRGKSLPELSAIADVGATIEYIPHFSWDKSSEK